MIEIKYYLIIFLMCLVPFLFKNRYANYEAIPIKNNNPINGIRGILASLVMFSHAFKDFYIYIGNPWIFDKNYFDLLGYGNQATNTGKIGVAIFFMISGYLFYRLLNGPSFNLKKFIKNRFLRIFPLYAFVVSFCIIIGLIISDQTLDWGILVGIAKWYTFFGSYDVLNIATMTKGVEWTLKLEILLYASIPILFYLFQKINNQAIRHLLILGSILSIFIAGFLLRIYGKVYIDPRAALCFYVGYVALEIKGLYSFQTFLQSKIATILAILFFLSSFFISSHNLFYLYLIASCGFLFLCLSSGNNLFGLLDIEPLQKLGEISYSIYLIHGCVLYGLMQLIKYFSIENHLILVLILIVFFYATYTISTFSFIHIEQRFLNFNFTKKPIKNGDISIIEK
ncbi:acyltransferase family protein [Acinetobacter pittii]|uniref:acyltransferase family protein n=1 Tax=Acinetobacter pittii TaxID=48296 RepID=UPI0039793599